MSAPGHPYPGRPDPCRRHSSKIRAVTNTPEVPQQSTPSTPNMPPSTIAYRDIENAIDAAKSNVAAQSHKPTTSSHHPLNRALHQKPPATARGFFKANLPIQLHDGNHSFPISFLNRSTARPRNAAKEFLCWIATKGTACSPPLAAISRSTALRRSSKTPTRPPNTCSLSCSSSAPSWNMLDNIKSNTSSTAASMSSVAADDDDCLLSSTTRSDMAFFSPAKISLQLETIYR